MHRHDLGRAADQRGTCSVSGICEGAPVLTARGMRAVETLNCGDRILTSAGAQPLLARSVKTLVCHATYILAGSLGHRCQRRDSLLPSGQTVLLRDWRARLLYGQTQVLVPINALTDGEFIRSLGQVPLTIYQLRFALPCVLHADAMELSCTTPRKPFNSRQTARAAQRAAPPADPLR